MVRTFTGVEAIIPNDTLVTTTVQNHADSGVDLELGFWIKDPESGSQNVRSDLSLALLAQFRARGIEIPYPRREVRIMRVPHEK